MIQDKFTGCYVEGDAAANGDKVRFVIDKEQLSDDGEMMVEPFSEYDPDIYKTHGFYQDDHTIVMKEAV